MSQMKNMAGAFIIFYMCVALLGGAWSGFEEGYDIDEQELEGGLSVIDKLQELNFIEGISKFTDGIFKISTLSSFADLLGGLALAGSGILQLIGGIVLFPAEIVGAITPFYGFVIPPIIGQSVGVLVMIGVGFVLLSAKMGFSL